MFTILHIGLSTYDACKKLLPTLDVFQSRLGLSSFELRKLVLRMPSLVGMGLPAFEERLDFFVNQGSYPNVSRVDNVSSD